MGKKQKERANRKPLFCGKCGRVIYHDSPDFEWWLVGIGTGSHVIRCPQHITEWTMRTAGKGRSQSAYKWRRLAKEQDKYDYRQMVYEPLYLEEDI
jgi:hypothetical protein